MASAELQKHLVEQPVDLPAAEAVDAIDDAADSRLAAGIEESGNDAANIAGEGDRQTPDLQRTTFAIVVCWFHRDSLPYFDTEPAVILRKGRTNAAAEGAC